MVEAVVSTILERLALVLQQQVEQEVRLVVGVDEEVKRLTSNFQAIQCVLEDAECKQVKEKAVGDWLEKLKEVSCNVENVLDEWNTAIQKRRIVEADEDASKLVRKVRSLIYCSGFISRQIVRHDIPKNIQCLNKALDVIVMEGNLSRFSSNKGIDEVEQHVTSSVVDVTRIHCRDHVKTDIKNLLLSESSNGPASLPIISIVGMGGISKTTLARIVFNDEEVKGFFDRTVWVCVFEPVERSRIAKAILKSLKDDVQGVKEYENDVLQNIKELIKDKKFLLVLDDVRNGDSDKCEELADSLKQGCSKSRILLTTCKENVTKLMESIQIIQLEMLSNQGSWSLFSQVAFSGRTNEKCQKFIKIGRKIVKKCKGLPLAIKTLGSLLHFKNTIKEWKLILDSEMWELEQAEKGIFPSLLFTLIYPLN